LGGLDWRRQRREDWRRPLTRRSLYRYKRMHRRWNTHVSPLARVSMRWARRVYTLEPGGSGPSGLQSERVGWKLVGRGWCCVLEVVFWCTTVSQATALVIDSTDPSTLQAPRGPQATPFGYPHCRFSSGRTGSQRRTQLTLPTALQPLHYMTSRAALTSCPSLAWPPSAPATPPCPSSATA
jgi:hypothetical protein